MKQFQSLVDTEANIRTATGWLIETRTGRTVPIGDDHSVNVSVQTLPDLNGERSFSSNPPVYFQGGSGRNVFVETSLGGNCPRGYFKAYSPLRFAGVLFGQASLRYGADGSVELHDGEDVIATAAAGTVRPGPNIPCSALASAGGDGGGSFVVELGTATGMVALNFAAFSVPDQFVVTWNGSTVIDTGLRGENGVYDGVTVVCDGPGDGTMSFNKTSAGPSTAIVTVLSPYTGTAWEFTLGCPGGGAPPYPPSSLINGGSYEMAATAYGKDAYNAGADFDMTVTVEKAYLAPLSFPAALVMTPDGTAVGGRYTATDADHYAAEGDATWTLTVNADGSADIKHGSNLVAARAAGGVHDPSGYYLATEYGATNHFDGAAVNIAVVLEITQPLEGWSWVEITESEPGIVASVAGPFRGPTMPAAAGLMTPWPISHTDGAGSFRQIQDGPILWAGNATYSLGVPWVTLTAYEYAILDPKDPNTIYDISDYEPV